MDKIKRPDIETLKSFLNAFNRHDLDAIMEFFSEDCVLEMPRGPDPWGRRCRGREQVRAGLATRFSGIPDVQYLDDEHWSCEGHGVSKWRITGTTKSGDHINVHGCDLLDFRDGKITKKDSYWKIVEKE